MWLTSETGGQHSRKKKNKKPIKGKSAASVHQANTQAWCSAMHKHAAPVNGVAAVGDNSTVHWKHRW